EILAYVFDTCPKDFTQTDKKPASTPRKKRVTFANQLATSNSRTHNHVGQQSTQNASGSQPRSILKSNRILPAKSDNKKKVEEHPRTFKSSAKTTNRVDSSISSKRTVINSNSQSVCQTCNKCLFLANHDLCVVTYLHNLNALSSVKNVQQVWRPKQAKPVGKPKQAKPARKPKRVKQVWKPKPVKQVWKPTGKIFTTVGCKWVPTGKTFTLGDQCPLTRLTTPPQVTDVVVANPTEHNQNWGSNLPNSPFFSGFKCRSYRSYFGIWTQSAQNI
nr:hypothetical protein [Tanacetum cinerariifolium]